VYIVIARRMPDSNQIVSRFPLAYSLCLYFAVSVIVNSDDLGVSRGLGRIIQLPLLD